MNEESRGAWYLLTGLILGLIAGVAIALIFTPSRFTDIAPQALRSTDKDSYRALIAMAFAADGDYPRARARLDLLKDSDPAKVLGAQAQRMLAQGLTPMEAQALAQLAVVIEHEPVSGATLPTGLAVVTSTPEGMATVSLTPAGPEITGTILPSPEGTNPDANSVMTATPKPKSTSTPEATFTPYATITVPAALSAAFELDKKDDFCNPVLASALIQVEVYDKAGQPVPGARITVTWEGGEDVFFTGLHPEVNPGYADFKMKPGVVYSLQVGESGEVVKELKTIDCTSSMGSSYPGGWSLRFVQP